MTFVGAIEHNKFKQARKDVQPRDGSSNKDTSREATVGENKGSSSPFSEYCYMICEDG